MKKVIFALVLIVLALFPGYKIADAREPFKEFYGDFIASDLLGVSSYANFKLGMRYEDIDLYGFIYYDWADTTKTDLPYQYRFQGATAGVEARYWLMSRDIFFLAGYGRGLNQSVKGKDNFRAGFAGYKAFEKGLLYSDVYGELIWQSRADDVYLNIRYRPGRTLMLDEDSRLWTYAIFQIWASGSGDLGTENRAETGIGLGYIVLNGRMSANLEARAGHSFRGEINKKNYFNPMFILSAGF